MNKPSSNRLVILSLLIIFTLYNVVIYTQNNMSPVNSMSETALKGQQLWQKNNCTACHQLYGLGGYLGPDLTNTISTPGKGGSYVSAFLNSGIKSMPKFHFTEDEKNQIVAFLSHVDSTGYYPNREANFGKDGWVNIEYK